MSSILHFKPIVLNFRKFIYPALIIICAFGFYCYENFFDRGHLCPAGDRKFSYEAFEETFLTSNISPQLPQFNQGIWNQLEQRVRYWTKMYNKLIVVTGRILNKDLTNIGYESVSNYFYKIIFRQASDTYYRRAFMMPKQADTELKIQYQTSVDSIEKLTGIDFFEAMNNVIEGKLETSIDRKIRKF